MKQDKWTKCPSYSGYYECQVSIASRNGTSVVTKQVFYSTLWSQWKVDSCTERVIAWSPTMKQNESDETSQLEEVKQTIRFALEGKDKDGESLDVLSGRTEHYEFLVKTLKEIVRE